MATMTMTRAIAKAAAWDAANAQMRAEGRTRWNEDDYNLCCTTFDRLWPEDKDGWDDYQASRWRPTP